MVRKNLIKGAAILGVSQVVVAVSTFVRNIIIARAISVEDFGIAATFAITLSLIEMTSNLAFDKILVQDESGGGDEFLASTHFLQFIKSLFIGCLLFLLAPLAARFFGLQETTWAFQLIAVTPVIRGLIHFDSVTQQRDMFFVPTAVIGAVPQIIALLIAYPLAYWFGDYKAVLALSIFQDIVLVLISHLLATRPYRWTINKMLLYKKFHFGWPLMINGFLLFIVFNGDKSIVGRYFGMETLGWFGAVFALTLMPTVLFAKVSTTLLLPPLSRSQKDIDKFNHFSNLSMLFCFSVGVFVWVFFTLAGEAIIFLSYGEKYIQGASAVSLLALLQSIRIIRIAPTITSIAQADTKNSMLSNFSRMVFLPGAILLAALGYSINTIMVCSILGEICAVATSVAILKLHSGKKKYVKMCILNTFVFIGVLIIMQICGDIMGEIDQFFVVLIAFMIASLFAVGFLLLNKDIRGEVVSLGRYR